MKLWLPYTLLGVLSPFSQSPPGGFCYHRDLIVGECLQHFFGYLSVRGDYVPNRFIWILSKFYEHLSS